MDRPDPRQLLRTLEEEANTLRSMMAKVANTIHCLQVEDEHLSKQLANVDKAANEVDQRTEISDQADSVQAGSNESNDNSLGDFSGWTPTSLYPRGPGVETEDTFGTADPQQGVQVDEDDAKMTNGTNSDYGSGGTSKPVS